MFRAALEPAIINPLMKDEVENLENFATPSFLFHSVADSRTFKMGFIGGGRSNERPFRRSAAEDASSASVIVCLTSFHHSLSLSFYVLSRFLSIRPTRSLGSASLTDKCAADGQIGIYGSQALHQE